MLDILSAIGEFYVWQYLPDGQLVSTTCPHEMLEELMIYEKAQSSIFEHGRTNREPCIIWTNAGFYGLPLSTGKKTNCKRCTYWVR